MRIAKLLWALLLLLAPVGGALAQTGKIAGTVRDAGSREPLPGVNVVIEGTTQGSVTDIDGYYSIINVRPGTYRLQASFVGYAPQVVQNVQVSTGLTTEINFDLQEQAVGLDEVVVTSERPVVQLDVSANVASLTSEDFVDLPIAGVSEVLDLQAGIEPGLQIRGGGMNELAFVVDGLNLRTGRDQDPFTNISYTSLEEVQVQTGGFNAEFGNVRAGVVNVTTKEPARDRYSFDGLFRLTPAQDRSFGALGVLPAACDYSNPTNIDPNCNSYWVRPAFDPDVAFDGTTAGGWDIYTQRQYRAHSGWNTEATTLQGLGFDVSPQDMQEYYRYTHRKNNEIEIPDYQADFTLGGPLVPGVSRQLGDLRFLFSYRGTQSAYSLPQTRNSFDTNTFQGKITSNIQRGMKLTLHGMYGTERGMVANGDLPRVALWQGNLPSYPWQDLFAGGWEVQPVSGIAAERGDAVYSDALMNTGDIDHAMFGATFTHTLNANTFYEVSIQNVASKYRSHFANLRDDAFICPSNGVAPDNGTACVPGSVVARSWATGGANSESGRPTGIGTPFCFGGDSDVNGDGSTVAYCVGEAPLGYNGNGGNLIGSSESSGGHWNKTRDTTDVGVFSGRFNLTSQLNRFLQMKTGAEVIVSDYDVNSERFSQELGFFYEGEHWDRTPIQGAAYVQGKLEFQGMIANLGVRLDYFDANSEWWVFENPYDQALRGDEVALDELLDKETPDPKVYLSPRLGVAFPITVNSKLYFNYGHFRQMLSPFSIFGVRTTPQGGIDVIGFPEHPMPQTVAYELGFDQNLFDQFLLRVSGFYRDIREQARDVTFHSLGDVVNYVTQRPWNYEDVRGAEVTLSKNRGRWLRGFMNYTFLQTKSGNFGFAQFYENSFDQLTYLRTSTDYRQEAPLAQPFARLNLNFLTPPDFGDAASPIVGDWRVSLLGEWRSGEKWTWNGGSGAIPELQNNVAWRDFMNFDLRFTKHFNTRYGSMQLFFDIDNVFNRRHLYNASAFADSNRDFDYYMWSLHLPGDIFDRVNAVNCAVEGVSVGDCDFADKRGLPGELWVPGDDEPGAFRKPGVAFQPIEAVQSLPASPAAGEESAWYWAADTEQYSEWNGSAWVAVADNEVQQVLDDKAYIDMPNYAFNTFLNPRRYTVGLRLSF
jgi:hypothetical protein